VIYPNELIQKRGSVTEATEARFGFHCHSLVASVRASHLATIYLHTPEVRLHTLACLNTPVGQLKVSSIYTGSNWATNLMISLFDKLITANFISKKFNRLINFMD